MENCVIKKTCKHCVCVNKKTRTRTGTLLRLRCDAWKMTTFRLFLTFQIHDIRPQCRAQAQLEPAAELTVPVALLQSHSSRGRLHRCEHRWIRAAVGHGAPGIACTAAATSSIRATGRAHPWDAAAGPPSRPRRWPWASAPAGPRWACPAAASGTARWRLPGPCWPQHLKEDPQTKQQPNTGVEGKGGVEKTGVELLGANKCLDLLKKPDPFYDGFNPWNLRSAVWQLWMCSLKSGSKASQLEPSNSMAAVLCSL